MSKTSCKHCDGCNTQVNVANATTTCPKCGSKRADGGGLWHIHGRLG